MRLKLDVCSFSSSKQKITSNSNLLFSSSFSSAELLARLDISGGVPTRPDERLKSESPELHAACDVDGTRRYRATSLLDGDKTESEDLDSVSGSAFAFSHLNAALTFVHFDTFGKSELVKIF